MKILHLDYDDIDNPYAGGGQAKATLEINRRLVKKNKVVVITGNYPGAIGKKKFGIDYVRAGLGNFGSTISIITYWLFAPLIAWKIQKDFDLVVEFFTAPFSASVTPMIIKKPVIACPTFFDAKELSKKYKIPFHLIEERGIKNYKFFIALTPFIKTKIKNLNPQAKITVIPRGVEQEYFTARSNEGKYIIYLGRIDVYQKGLDLLVKCWQDVVKQYPDIKLIIVGGGKVADENKLRILVNRYNLINNVLLMGVLRGREKIELLANSLCVVNTSRWETFGNSALEALAVGKPLVCFDIDGYKWIPDDVSVKVEKFNTKNLSDNLINLIRKKKLRLALGNKAKKFASKYDWLEVEKKYAAIYLDVIKLSKQ
jgi:glycosyltransferase involved in cell wall biosynthesis